MPRRHSTEEDQGSTPSVHTVHDEDESENVETDVESEDKGSATSDHDDGDSSDTDTDCSIEDDDSIHDSYGCVGRMADLSELFSTKYGLKDCLTMNLGEYTTDVPLHYVRVQKARYIIEKSLFPIGLAVPPNGHYAERIALEMAYEESMGCRDWDPDGKANVMATALHQIVPAVHHRCKSIVSRGKSWVKSAPLAFSNLMSLFATVLRPYKWPVYGPMSTYISRLLDEAVKGMLKTFTDKELGLIGNKSRKFITKAVDKFTKDAVSIEKFTWKDLCGYYGEGETTLNLKVSSAVLETIQEFFDAKRLPQYGLDRIKHSDGLILQLGEVGGHVTVPSHSTNSQRIIAVVENDILPVGLAVCPESDHLLETTLRLSAMAQSSADGLRVYEKLTDRAVTWCGAALRDKSGKNRAPAFSTLIYCFFLVTRNRKLWASMDPQALREVFSKLNDAVHKMLSAFTSKELGLIGTKSNVFVTKAFKKATIAAAESVGDSENLPLWGVSATGIYEEEDLPTKRTRKE